MVPSSPKSGPSSPLSPEVPLSFPDNSPRVRRLMAQATSPSAAAATSNAGGPLEESQLTDTCVYPRLLSFLQREPSVFTPWNPLPPLEEEQGGAAAKAGFGEEIRLGKGPILPFSVDRPTNFGCPVGEVGRRLPVLVRCPCCHLSRCGRLMPCWSCAWRYYAMFCNHEPVETLNDQSSLNTPL